MTIEELKKIDDKYGESGSALEDITSLILDKRILNFNDRISDETISFWSKILDGISDEYVKELVYEVFSEYIYYRELDCFDDLEELSKAYYDDRCFIFDFKPGDFIATKYGEPEKVISITMHGAGCYPVVNTERRYVEQHVAIVENEIDYTNINKYYKVDNVQTYSLANRTGEDWEDYWC
jgi:DNA relaxase NicK